MGFWAMQVVPFVTSSVLMMLIVLTSNWSNKKRHARMRKILDPLKIEGKFGLPTADVIASFSIKFFNFLKTQVKLFQQKEGGRNSCKEREKKEIKRVESKRSQVPNKKLSEKHEGKSALCYFILLFSKIAKCEKALQFQYPPF